jgi:uncharacterized RDD family membrane protein YckC
MPAQPEPAADAALPAGFWQRAAAWTLDAALLAIPAWWLTRPAMTAAAPAWRRAGDALSLAVERPLRALVDGAGAPDAAMRMLADPALTDAAAALQQALVRSFAAPVAALALLAFAWHAGFERSAWQASPGKRALGLRVVDRAGAEPALWRSIWRFFAGTASWLTLNLGHALAALPPRHLALHDRLSGTRVLAGRAGLPVWAKAWLLLLALLLLAANVWLLLELDALVQAALERALRI